MIHTPQPFSDAAFAPVLSRFVHQPPLVHCMTNEVVQNVTANVLLALHASPAMVVDNEEAAQFATLADALLINVGTLTRDRCEAMLAAVRAAHAAQTPWVLDPVAAGALTLRTDFCHRLLAQQPAAVRGNASEILALARQGAGGRGVDTQHPSEAALEAARELALRHQTLVAISGEVDYVTDGHQTLSVQGGSALMTHVVGTGCALSAVVAAFCSLPGDRLSNVASACRVMARAGERAAAQTDAPGTFATLFIDALWQQAQEARA
ncbi:hydroxyethylthiazole kinase [Pantoea sp. KPR_PJ]|uniref:hydroxyethylthiazole kinase n=1 Tax=Pantoea sp. KPR_PJ TaxID=2738375 RepID=UPI003529A104